MTGEGGAMEHCILYAKALYRSAHYIPMKGENSRHDVQLGRGGGRGGPGPGLLFDYRGKMELCAQALFTLVAFRRVSLAWDPVSPFG